MRLLLDEDPHATAAGAVSIVTGGSSADPVGAEGLAHLVEHLAYRAVDPATPGAGAGEPSGNRRDRLTRLGAVASNAHTTHDCLIFYELGPTARLDALLTLATSRLVRRWSASTKTRSCASAASSATRSCCARIHAAGRGRFTR